MGWGTFAAGLAISYVVNPGRNTANDLSTVEELEGYIEVAHHYLYQPFKRSWQRKLLRGSALLHPEVWESVDLDVWEEDINDHLRSRWWILMVIQLVNGVSAFLFPPLIALAPLWWYYPKARGIKQHQDAVNQELRDNGWDVDRLLGELVFKLQEQNTREAEAEAAAEAEAEADRKRRKYGKSVD